MPGVSLTTSSLTKRYGAAEALRLDDLVLHPGERVGLVGNNGAGKTTFLRLALDLIAPTTGHVALDGIRVGGPDLGWTRASSSTSCAHTSTSGWWARPTA